MPILTVMPTGHTYIPEELKDKGYKGQLEAILSTSALIIPQPGADARDVVKSLKHMTREFELRAEIKKRQDQKPLIDKLTMTNGKLAVDGQPIRYNAKTKRFYQEPVKKEKHEK